MIHILKRLVLIGSLIGFGSINAAEIVTLDRDPDKQLTTQCQIVNLDKNGLADAQKIITELKESLRPLMPAAGLAAPQIGINQRIFIFSWDRTEPHQIAVINPSFTPIGDEKEKSWEVCFSVLLGKGPYQAANVPRYRKIKVTYLNEHGQSTTQTLEGFAARVFQHEYDHIEGMENIHRKDAEIKTFESRDATTA